jgi:nucleoside-triphosphatase THEP1
VLFVLTGDIQIGKSRWLEQVVADLGRQGVSCAGVIAPGVWRPCDQQPPEALVVGAKPGDPYEKRGIDNVMLPQGQRVRFADRRDLARRQTEVSHGMGWVFYPQAIDCVNDHFAKLRAHAADADARSGDMPGLLVVDELGRLELLRNEGLTQALALLDQGPTDCWPHAVIVVRNSLKDRAVERFSPSWSHIAVIGPTEESRRRIFALFPNRLL